MERAKRTSDFHHKEESSFVRTSDHSPYPFCPGHESETEEVLLEYPADAAPAHWSVRVVPNKFPAFRGKGDAQRSRHGVYFTAPAVSAHEAIIERPEHGKSPRGCLFSQWNWVLSAYCERYLALREEVRTVQLAPTVPIASGRSA